MQAVVSFFVGAVAGIGLLVGLALTAPPHHRAVPVACTPTVLTLHDPVSGPVAITVAQIAEVAGHPKGLQSILYPPGAHAIVIEANGYVQAVKETPAEIDALLHPCGAPSVPTDDGVIPAGAH